MLDQPSPTTTKDKQAHRAIERLIARLAKIGDGRIDELWLVYLFDELRKQQARGNLATALRERAGRPPPLSDVEFRRLSRRAKYWNSARKQAAIRKRSERTFSQADRKLGGRPSKRDQVLESIIYIFENPTANSLQNLENFYVAVINDGAKRRRKFSKTTVRKELARIAKLEGDPSVAKTHRKWAKNTRKNTLAKT